MPALICTDCGASSETARFYSGINKRCAECHKQRVRQNRKANPLFYAAYEAMRYARDYEKRRAAAQAYARSAQGKALKAASTRAWAERNAAKRAAHGAVQVALKAGRLIRPTACEACGAARRLHGHHDDYAKPLDVRWLCTPCHALAHHGERAISAHKRQQQEPAP